MNKKNIFMMRAIELSIESINLNGGPFGCVIVKNNKIIAEGSNKVTTDNDPTAHGEIVAIRTACQKLNTFNLSGCDLYSSCEPCPMCLSAIYWSRIENIFYANTRIDAKNIDFDDSFIYSEINKDLENRKIKMHQMHRDEALEAFKIWKNKEDKIKY
jgi:tRNA(Arg) A34 adenosine deaminase TadA